MEYWVKYHLLRRRVSKNLQMYIQVTLSRYSHVIRFRIYHNLPRTPVPFLRVIRSLCVPETVCAVLCLVAQPCPTFCNPMDCSLPGSSVHRDSPDKNTGVGCHALFQGIFPTQGLNLGLPQCRWMLYCLNHQRSSPHLLNIGYSTCIKFPNSLNTACDYVRIS